jgi:DNA invertase Pin-like site-specific DNA recombinase
MANLMLSVMGAFAEFERALIRERQRRRHRGSLSNAEPTEAERSL